MLHAAKNVAAEIAEKLCASVSARLEGKQTGTLESVRSTVRQALQDACVQMLTPKRNIDILRDVNQVRTAGRSPRPYVLVFCGVNGVGKSTNLAKVYPIILSIFQLFHTIILLISRSCILLHTFTSSKITFNCNLLSHLKVFSLLI